MQVRACLLYVKNLLYLTSPYELFLCIQSKELKYSCTRSYSNPVLHSVFRSIKKPHLKKKKKCFTCLVVALSPSYCPVTERFEFDCRSGLLIYSRQLWTRPPASSTDNQTTISSIRQLDKFRCFYLMTGEILLVGKLFTDRKKNHTNTIL